MTLHDEYGLTRVINGAGTFTPLGVSRSSPGVAQAVAAALQDFFVIDELQELASRRLAAYSGAEAGAVTHCVSAAITLAVAATMTGEDAQKVAALPDSAAMPNRVVLPAGHAVNYGHPLVQDIRLTGATPLLAGNDEGCTPQALEDALAEPGVACLLLVSSRLVRGAPLDLAQAVALAHRHGIPAVIDGAAQDMRVDALLATGADLVLVSAHKYLAAPTAGLVFGRRALVAAVRAQEKGIGRAMKATKEAIVGVLKALEERSAGDPVAWQRRQDDKVAAFQRQAGELPGVRLRSVPDPAGMPFSRVALDVDPVAAGMDAAQLAQRLKSGEPSVRVMEHEAGAGRLMLELVPLDAGEIALIAERLRAVVSGAG